MKLNVRSAIVAMLLGLPVMAMAQQDPTFSIESKEAAPGESVTLTIFLEKGVANTAALNFTVQVPAADAALVSGAITGSAASTLPAGYQDPENNLTVGGNKQYRGVLYAQTSTVPAFDSTAKIPVWTITVPVAASAADGSVINVDLLNTFDTDGKTALVGVSDSAGNSIVATGASPATTRPKVSGGTITVRSSFYEQDFVPLSAPPTSWTFEQIIPAPADVSLRGENRATSGFEIEFVKDNTFGFLGTKPGGANNLQPANGTILFTKWDVTSAAASPFDVPTFRVRATASDASFSQFDTIQETQPNFSAPTLPPTGNTVKTFTSATFVPTSVNDGENQNGFDLGFDIVAFGTQGTPKPLNGTLGTKVVAKKVVAKTVTVDSLGAGTELVNLDFSGSATHGFAPLSSVIPGFDAPATATATGLNIDPQDNLVSLSQFSLGIWEASSVALTGGGNLAVSAGKLYRVDFRISSSVADRTTGNTGRIRLTVGEGSKFVSIAAISSDGDNNGAPDQDGENYSMFVNFPDELAGLPIKVAFDAFNVNPADTGSLTLQSLKVTSFTRPTL